MSEPARKKILITGASGGLAQIAVHRLSRGYDLVGVDPRPLANGRKFPGEFVQVDYRQRKMAEVFRQHSFHAMMHLGRMPLGSGENSGTRFNVNVLGTRNLLELAHKYCVPNVIVCSTFHVYGAHPHNHLYMTEDDPLRALQTFPEMADAVELDNFSTNFILKHAGIRTVVLRPVNVIGPRVMNRISIFLRAKYCPMLLGYDPVLQFMHEEDLAQAFQLALESQIKGAYNVAGEGVIPFSKAIEIAGAIPVPVPHFIAYAAASIGARFGTNFPRHLIDYFRFPTVISDAAFRRETGYAPKISTVEALTSMGTATR